MDRDPSAGVSAFAPPPRIPEHPSNGSTPSSPVRAHRLHAARTIHGRTVQPAGHDPRRLDRGSQHREQCLALGKSPLTFSFAKCQTSLISVWMDCIKCWRHKWRWPSRPWDWNCWRRWCRIRPLWKWKRISSITGAGDVNGDSIQDVLLGTRLFPLR